MEKIIYGALIVIFTQVIIIIPWILSGTSAAFINVLKGLFGLYTYVSLYAGNVWYLMLPGELRWTADNNSWHGLTFKLWGLIMLSVFLLITLIPLISSVWTKWKNKSAQLPVESVFAIGALSVMAFFSSIHKCMNGTLFPHSYSLQPIVITHGIGGSMFFSQSPIF